MRVAQHVELKLREMLPQLSVTKGEYTSDRIFTENALENLRLDLEDLKLSERARDESTGGGQHPPLMHLGESPTFLMHFLCHQIQPLDPLSQ